MEFGERISKLFVDALETGHDTRALINLHNNEVGRLVSQMYFNTNTDIINYYLSNTNIDIILKTKCLYVYIENVSIEMSTLKTKPETLWLFRSLSAALCDNLGPVAFNGLKTTARIWP